MVKKRKRSFETRLIAYILSVCSITFVIIFLILYVLPRISQYNNAVIYSKMSAEKVIAKITEEANIIKKTLELFRLSPIKESIINGDSSLFKSILHNSPEIAGCAIEFDSNYRSYDYFAYREDEDILFMITTHSDSIFSDKRIIEESRDNYRFHWSKYYYNHANKGLIFSIFDPIFDESSNFIGYLRLDIEFDRFAKFVDDLKVYDSGYACIIDKDGTLLSYSNPEIIRYKECSTQIIKILDNKKGTAEINFDGVDFLIYFEPIPHTDWTVIVLSPLKEIYGYMSKTRDIIMVSCLIILLLLFRILSGIIKKVLKPLQQFVLITRTIAEGNYNVPLPKVSHNDELKELRDSFMYMQQQIIKSMDNLKNTTAEKEKIESEIRVAQRIQERFLPIQNNITNADFSLYAILEQSKSVGGDIYFYVVNNNKLHIAVGDVRGKGVPAALYMSSVSTLFNYLARRDNSSSDICNVLNEYISENAGDDMFITMFIAIVDLETGVVKYTNAGHPYPIIKRDKRGGETYFLKDALDIPLGITQNIYKEKSMQLEKDDILLIYTDGITEVQNQEFNFYGKERLLKIVSDNTTTTPEELINIVLTDLLSFIGDSTEPDDLTMLSFKYNKDTTSNQSID